MKRSLPAKNRFVRFSDVHAHTIFKTNRETSITSFVINTTIYRSLIKSMQNCDDVLKPLKSVLVEKYTIFGLLKNNGVKKIG